GEEGSLIPKYSNNINIDPQMIKKLNEVQNRIGKQIIIESGVRPYKHNLWSWAVLESNKTDALNSGKVTSFGTSDIVSLTSWHIFGGAADFRVEGWDTDADMDKYKALATELNALGYAHAYKIDEGRDPDNWYDHPYIHFDTSGFNSIQRGKFGEAGRNINYQKVEKPSQTAEVVPAESTETPGAPADSGIKLSEKKDGSNEIYIIEVNPTNFDVEVATSKTGNKLQEINKLMRSGDVAAINAGFFLADGNPSSLIVENGVKISDNQPLSGNMPAGSGDQAFNGCFIVKDSGGTRTYDIVDITQLKVDEVKYAICSPWLVKDGAVNFPCDQFDQKRKLEGKTAYCSEANRRSVLAIKDDGSIHLINAKTYTIPKLGEYIAANYKKAIALDGGGSVSLEYHNGGTDKTIGWDTGNTQRKVSSAIVVKPKGAASGTGLAGSTAGTTTAPQPTVTGVDISGSMGDGDVYYLQKTKSNIYLLKKKPGVKQCGVEKREYKFCVNSSKRVLYFDEQLQKTLKRYVQYKFAIEFPDKIPPPQISNLKAEDKSKAESSIVFEWDAPKQGQTVVQDLNHYLIYCTDTDFVRDSGNNVILDGLKNPQRVSLGEDHIKVQAGYCAGAQLQDGKEYSFVVVPVDNSLNKGPGKEIKATSIDDLAPGPVEITVDTVKFTMSGQVSA
ncbi:MAG: phosphodiester glycosidase family protein, partial [Nanoarchaeota archaeon]|nr:phosphodiester glycosidase family protein [Nanoarchaeota archaeon]